MIPQRHPDSHDRLGSRDVLGAATMPNVDGDAAGGVEDLPLNRRHPLHLWCG
jgi:hypothetical protein